MCSYLFFFFLMILRPPRSTRTDTLFPYTTLFRSVEIMAIGAARSEIAQVEGELARDGHEMVDMIERGLNQLGIGAQPFAHGIDDMIGAARNDRPLDRKSTRLNSSQ